jgi:DNA polymerase III alpha subunit
MKDYSSVVGDFDVDMSPTFEPSSIFKQWVRASQVKDGKLIPHPSGYYPQTMPVDPVTKLAAIPYSFAEQQGFFKVDFLHLNIYKHVKSRADLLQLVNKEPDWSQLQLPSVQMKLFQLSNHGLLLDELKPSCILDLADCLALIRPGKRQLLPIYKKDKEVGRRMLWAKQDNDSYTFKKSHAISYALVIVLQLNLVEASRM